MAAPRIDGGTADVCVPAVTTCTAIQGHRMAAAGCDAESPAADAACGAAGFDDAVCVERGPGDYVCANRCTTDEDCLEGVLCDTGAVPRRCELM
jgi:hypothetical protein